MSLRIGVVGAGGFGRAIARASARHGHEVTLWSRKERELPDPIQASTDIMSMRDRDLIFMAVPARHAAEAAEQLGEVVDGRNLMVHISRGLIGSDLKTITQVIREKTVCRRLGALAGPLMAEALAEGRPSGAILGTGFPELTEMVREAIGGSELRVYDTPDVLGVELASEIKQQVALDLHVVESAQDVLEPFELLGPRVDYPPWVETVEELEEVSELLGVDAQTV